MKMASETTPLTSGEESRTYLFLSQRHRNRRNRIRQFQCCVCAAMLGIFVTAMVITVSYSMNHDPDDDLASNETNTQVLLPVPANTAALKKLLSLKWPRPDIAPPDWSGPMPTDAQIAKAIEAGELSLQQKDEIEARAAMKMGNPSSPSILQLGTPFYMHQEAIKTTANAIKAARVGYVMGKATQELTKGKPMKHSVGKGPQVNPYYIPTGMVCKSKSLKAGMNTSSTDCPPSRYRTMDGSCNNLVHPDWGVAMRPLRRVIPPDYSDGVSAPRAAKDGSLLPSARDVSLTVHRPIYRNDPNFTVMLAVWGQFFDHDITATALSKSSDGTPISCCTEDGKVASDNVNPECYPVKLSPEDPYYADYGMSCMNFVRSAPAPTCNLGPREQLNQITSFIDGSVVYGSSEEQAKHLRSTSKKGELEMMITPDGRELLPVSTDPKDGCNKPEMNADGKYCFKSGDTRANENLHLTTMHLLLAREHNRIVRELAKMNPTWSDEKLYQEGRHIMAAQMQHITYNEFLPIVLGPSMMSKLQLAPQKKGYSSTYDPDVNPAVANNFATAAFRFAHTLLPTLMKILGNDTSSEEYVELHKILFNPYILYSPGQMTSALKGALNTDVQRVDTYITPEVTQHLFQQKWSEDYDKAMEKSGAKLKGKKKGYGLDLASLNVQRGRDHGLPSYPEWREYCGLSRPTSFSDLKGEMDEAALQRLASLYNSVDDVDMYSGSLSEIPIGEGLLGPTFSCLMADQFLRLKHGDRYWYETPELPQAFDPYQLDEIRRSSLAAIICENSGVDRVQQWVMQAVDDGNPRMMCEFIPRLRLSAWKDKSMVGHVKLSPFSMNVKTMPKKSKGLTAPSAAFGSSYIKGTVASASVTATGSDGTYITAMKPSTTFPVTLPAHLFDQKIAVAAGVAPGLPDGIIPPFYHGGGGVTWTGSLTSSDPTKAHFTGSFSVPVFKHGATAFDFSMVTYTGNFDINLNLAPTATPMAVPTLQGTYNSGIFYKMEPPAVADSPLTSAEFENLMAEAGKVGPKLPMAPIILYGAFSLDHTEFYWDGNVSIVIPPPATPVLAASGGRMAKPKAAAAPPAAAPSPFIKGTVASASITATGSDGTNIKAITPSTIFPVTLPAHLFDQKVAVAAGVAPALPPGIIPPFYHGGGGVTWTGSLTSSGPTNAHLMGSFSVPVFKHGATAFDFSMVTYTGNFDIYLDVAPTAVPMALPTLQGTYNSGIFYKMEPPAVADSPLSSAEFENLMAEAGKVGPKLPMAPILLYGAFSLDHTEFYWDGNVSIVIPPPTTPVLAASGGRMAKPKAAAAPPAAAPSPFIKGTVASASIIATGSDGTNIKAITPSTIFPVTLPAHLFDQKVAVAAGVAPALPPGIIPPFYHGGGGVTWTGSLTSSGPTNAHLMGSFSVPVFKHGATAFDFSMVTYTGNFDIYLDVAPTAVPMALPTLQGTYNSGIFYKMEPPAVADSPLSSAEFENLMAEAGKVGPKLPMAPILLYGAFSLDHTEFYWDGNVSIVIPPPATPVLAASGGRIAKPKAAAAPPAAAPSPFIKGTVASASITATGSDGTNIKAISPSTIFPVTLPAHLFDQKVAVAAGVAPALPPGIIPPFYHGGGGVTWTGSLTSSGPTNAHLMGSFSVPVFKHGATAFDFGMTTYTGNFDIYLDIAPTATPMAMPTLQGTYNSGIFFKMEPLTGVDSSLSGQEFENLMAEAGKVGPKLPMAPILLYGAFSLDHTEFYWDGNVSIIIPPSVVPVLGAPGGGMVKPKTVSTLVDVTAVWGLVKAKVGPPTDPGADNSKVVVTTWWDGKLPVAIPQPAFDRTVIAPVKAAASGKSGSPGNGITWSGSLMPIDGSDDVELNGTYSFPVFLHGSSPSGFALQIWQGDFSIKLRSSPAPGTLPLATSLKMLGSGVKYKSPIIFKSTPQVMAPPESTDDDVANITMPIILHGFTSIDKSIFYWNGSASIIVPQMGPNTLMAHGKGGRGRNGGRGGGHNNGGQDGGFGGLDGGFGGGGMFDGGRNGGRGGGHNNGGQDGGFSGLDGGFGGGGMFDGGSYGGRFSGGNSMFDRYGFEQSKLKAAGGGGPGPLILKITSASVTMSSTLSSNAPGKNITWNGEFPLTLPQSPFYRKDPLLVTGTDIDLDPPYSPLAAPAGAGKVSYKSELTWSNLSVKMNDSSPNDLQINGTLSFPVFYFPQTFTGPWPGATVETWNGNFSVVVNANSTTGSPTSVDNVLALLKMGNFTSTITYVEEKESEKVGKLAASGVGAAGSDATSPLKVTMLLHGIKSLDMTEFYWNGVITLIITGLPTDTTMLTSLNAMLTRNHLRAAGGPPPSPLELQLTSGTISMASVLNTNGTGKNYTWDGVFPVMFPQSPFYRKTLLTSSAGQITAPASSAKKSYNSELTWSNLSVKMMDTGTNDLQINGTLSYPVYYFPGKVLGPWPGPTIENWSGNFSVIVNANSTTGTPPPVSDLMTLISMGNFTSSVYFTETKKSTQSSKLAAAMSSSDPDVTSPLKVIMLLHGTKSLDLTQFLWSGSATVIIRGLPAAAPVATEFSTYAAASPAAAAGGVAAPLNLQITSGTISMASILNTNGTGKNYTWDGVFPITLPQSPFYRKTLLTSSYMSAGLLTAPASSAKKTYKSELTWSNLSVKMVDTATNDLQINGSLSYPVYYFPASVIGPWPGPTIENWSGNFSVTINANATTGTPVPLTTLMALINLGQFTSVVYFTEAKKAAQSGKLAAAMTASDPDTTTPLKVIMLLKGTKSVDLTEFYWNGAATVIIRGLPTPPPVAKEFSTYASASPAMAGAVTPSLDLQVSTGTVSMASVLNTNGTGKNYTWNGVFPVTLPQSPFYRKTPLTSSARQLGAPASPAKTTYKSELTWSNLSVKIINEATNDLQINGSLSYPVYYFPASVIGPWPGPTIENWSGNFSVTVNASSTTGTPVSLTGLMALINMGNFTSSVYFTDAITSTRSRKLAAVMTASDPDTTTPLKVIMLLRGTKSVDLTEFYWNGAVTVIIEGLPVVTPGMVEQSSFVRVAPNPAAMTRSYITGKVTSGNLMGQSTSGGSYWWSGFYPVPIGIPAFDTVSPNAGIFTWPFTPTFYNGSGGVTWKGSLSRISKSGKSGLSVAGSFNVPVFTHGNPSAYSVDVWSGSFEIEMDLYVDSPLIDSFPGGTHNSPLVFREHKPGATGDMLSSISNAVNEIQTLMMMSHTLASSGSVQASLPRTPIILWGHYSLDKSIFYWEGNATVIFEAPASPVMVPMNTLAADTDSEVTPPSQNLKLPFKILTGSMTVSSPGFGKKVIWDGKIPFTTLSSYFNGPNPNTSYIGGSMKWTGHITRSTDVLNGATFAGTYILPIFVHSNGGVKAETMTGDFSMSVSFTGTQNIVDWVPNAGTYSSIITIAPGKPSVQLSLEGTSNPFMTLAVNKLTKLMDEESEKEDPNLVMVLPACFFGDYDETHFTFSGDGITIVPTNVSALVQPKRQMPKVNLGRHRVSLPARSSAMMLADADSDVAPPSQNLKLPFKILTGSMTVSSPIFGKKLIWDGKIPFTTLTSYFNGPNPNTSYIGGSMKWTGHITRSTDVLNGATFEGSYMLPVFVHSNGEVMAETMTGDFSMSVSFTGTQNIVDWVPNAGTYSSIITIAPGKPSVQLALESSNNPFINLGVNKLTKLMEEDSMNEDPSVVMVLPACFFGDYDDTHFTFSGDGITIVPTNVSALVRPKRKTEEWYGPLTERRRNHLGRSHGKDTEPSRSHSRSLRLKEGLYAPQRKNIKLNFKIESGSLTVKSSGVGEMVLWDGKIPFTTLQSYFNGYSENTSFIGGPMKWTGHISRAAAEGNGAQIEGTFSVPVFVHSNDSEALEYMTGDFSMQISFSGPENIADYVPTGGKFSSILTIAPAHPNVELSLRQSQIEAKNNVLMDMALNDMMSSIESENPDLDTGDLIPMPICFFGYYDAEKFTFNGDAIVIIPGNLTNAASLEYESIVEDMETSTKLQIGAASPYITGTVKSGNVMGLSKAGKTYWWSGTLPLAISVPPFDSISPNADVFNWPYNPTFYNGTGGVTWSGNMALTSSVTNGLSFKGSFSVPVFNHGNPSAFSVDEWDGDFELVMSVIYNNTELGSSFPTGTFNSPLIFREYKTSSIADPSGYDLETIKEVENMMILTSNLGVSGGIHSSMPRVPVVLWGNYSADKTAFYWDGNITAIFPPMPTTLFTALDQQSSQKAAEDTSAGTTLRLPMNILAGKITSTSPVFGEKTLWDGSVPFTTLPSYFNKYSTNSSYVGGPVQWAGQISRNTAIGNGAQIKGSFVVPIFVPSNGTENFEYLSGEFSFVVKFNGTQNLADLVPNSGKYTTYVILGVSHDEYDSYMADYTDEEPETPTDKNTHLAMNMKQLTAVPDAAVTPTVMSIIFLGNYGLKGFTFTGEAIVLLPDTLPAAETPKLLQSSSKRNSPAVSSRDMPYPSSNFPYGQMNDFPYRPNSFPSYAPPKPQPKRKIKLFGVVKSGQIYGNNLGHRPKPMWTGSFPAIIPMPAFDRRSHHNESHPGHPHHPHRMDGGITWQATEMEMGRKAGYIEGNFFFPIYKHGKFHTYTIKMMAGHFSFTFTLPGDQSISRMLKYWKKYTSKMYFHHFHSDWDLFNPGIQGDQVRDKANKAVGKINKRDNNNGPIIILKGKRNHKTFEWSGKFILVFYVY
ncbi:uncharacterized protein LOC124157292 [Ischnura elegans]|uniref:uncharacterized protein LOC124157292 n=1 Tax=Ischnura elegans TaxID=197161 RepID=UPI001ED87890|nr:uncharacterized protein LOC124157292 [Ischnura elegans]